MKSSRVLYKFDSFCLDVEERVLLREGHVVPLPPKALSTLLVLIRHKGHLVEKDVLMNEVWRDEFVEENNLAQHIFMLRKALGEASDSPVYIETVPRRGYRFVGKLRELVDEDRDPGISSVAILPFVNASGNPSMEYLSDGITENILTRLSRLPQLKVMARSTVFRYKGLAVDPQEVGKRLEVRAVMMGRVQQLGEQLIVSAELVDAQDGSLIWGDRYHRQASDIFLLQEELASEISERLRLRLTKTQRASLTKRFTEDTEAYELYLKGRYSWNKRSDADLRKAVDYFRQAIVKDSNFALAYTGLADSLLLLALLGAEAPRKVMGEAKTAASKAIRLDDELGEAYASLAQIKVSYDWDWEGAKSDFQTALRLSPAYPTAHQWYGEFLMAMGETEQGLTELRRARDLDPLSLIINTDLGLHLHWAGQSDQAIEQLECALELEPNFFRAHFYLGAVYVSKYMAREAVAEMETAIGLTENPYTLAGVGHAYALFDERAKAEEVLERLLQLAQERYVSPATIALLHAGFPDHLDETLRCLNRAFEHRAGFLIWLNVCPTFERIRTDARFVDLLRRIGLPTSAALPEPSKN
jgi:TolB-like protein/Tfp pilus assembly protein PilF